MRAHQSSVSRTCVSFASHRVQPHHLRATRRFTIALACMASTVLVPSLARAAEVKAYPECKGEPTENDVSAAKGAYEAGEVSFQEADYDRSILYWEDAFRRDCTAVKLLLNLARAYELSGDHAAAVNALKTYLHRRPDAKDRSSVEKRIAKLEETLAEKKPTETPPPKKDPKPAPPPEEVEEAEAAPPEEADRPKKPIWPIVVTGVGVTVAVIGHGIYAAGEAERSLTAEDLGCDLDDGTCANTDDTDEVNVAGQDLRVSGAGIALAGHVTGLAGGILWWVLWTSDKYNAPETASPMRNLMPIVTPTFQGVAFSGSF